MRQRQPSFADVAAEGRQRKLKAKRGRHLAKIGELVPWEEFRPLLEEVWRTPGEGAQVRGGAEAVGRRGHVQGDGSGRTVQPVRRGARTRDRGPADFHGVPGPRASGPDAGRDDGVAVPGAAGEGGARGDALRPVRRLPAGAGLRSDGRADRGRVDRAGAEAAQQREGEPGDQVRGDTGRSGSSRPTSWRRRTWRRGGRRSTARASTATRTTSRRIAATSWCGATR